MQEYYFLFALALVFTIFATVQDLRKREVANWLSFSLIAFALAYRAFYASLAKSPDFFLFGLLGFVIMFAFGNAFYYMKAFAGGDAKLLMGFGAILPYQNHLQLIIFPILFIFVLFLSGAVYSLVYSAFIVAKNKKTFSKEFNSMFQKNKFLIILSIVLIPVFIILGFYLNFLFFLAILCLLPITFLYTKSLEKCMIFLTPPEKLTEGDWLEQPIKISRTTINKSVHGLSYKDIQLLKKNHKSVLIKQGIPFVPSFLIAMVLFFLVLKFQVLSFLF